jgi:outer membrane scaffolding protein for murein synthesis (MipA/OmpV family)
MTSSSASRLHTFTLTLAGALVAAAHGSAHAQDNATHWGLGVAGGVSQLPYAGDENRKRVLPLLFVENNWLRIAGTGIDFKLPSAGPVTFDLRLAYSFDGYKDGDSTILDGMAQRKHSVLGGGVVTWHDPLVNVSFETLADVSGHSKGLTAKLSADHPFRFGALELRPRVAARWMDSKYVDYYYGVRADEATPARSAYDAKAALNLETGVRASYAFAPHQVGFLDVGTQRLGNEIADSPLVGRRTLTSVGIGYLYQF